MKCVRIREPEAQSCESQKKSKGKVRMIAEPQKREKKSSTGARVVSASKESVVDGQRRAMAHRGPVVLRRAKAIQENSRVPGAVLVATFAVTIICLYLSAYATVTAEGFELARLRTNNKAENLRHDTLQAEISRLSLPQTVAERAKLLGMEQGTQKTVIIVSEKSSAAETPQRPIR